ncbi:hypothetical protein L6452_12837 [Arctium lappa]|uniref:Uncharacterized protein n=1 Tax=Arctium lappa TaxID=4217 RepID=A0ACB9CGH3_ARCLA|nr:hypothetical protein L6452_12837 [Arctium lappa]
MNINAKHYNDALSSVLYALDHEELISHDDSSNRTRFSLSMSILNRREFKIGRKMMKDVRNLKSLEAFQMVANVSTARVPMAQVMEGIFKQLSLSNWLNIVAYGQEGHKSNPQKK